MSNVASGTSALGRNTRGNYNVASGINALLSNRVGARNVAIGNSALLKSTGSGNIALGSSAGQDLATGSDNVYIANRGVDGDSGQIRIGTAASQNATFIAGISGKSVTANARQVLVSPSGKLGTAPAGAASTASLAATVERLQRQVERLRKQVKGG